MMRSNILLRGLLFFSMFCGGGIAWLYAATPEMVMRNAVPMILGIIDTRLIAAAITILGLGGLLTLMTWWSSR